MSTDVLGDVERALLRQFPPEIVHTVWEYVARRTWRHGRWMTRLPSDDPRYRMLRRVPVPTVQVHYDDDGEPWHRAVVEFIHSGDTRNRLVLCTGLYRDVYQYYTIVTPCGSYGAWDISHPSYCTRQRVGWPCSVYGDKKRPAAGGARCFQCGRDRCARPPTDPKKTM